MITDNSNIYNYLFDSINIHFNNSLCINCNKTITGPMHTELHREYIDYYCLSCNENNSAYSLYISKLHCFICTVFVHDIVFYYDYSLFKNKANFNLRIKYVYANNNINITFNKKEDFISHIINIKDNFKYFNRLKSIA